MVRLPAGLRAHLHLVTNHTIVAADEDSATAEADFQAAHRIGTDMWVLMGHYRYELVKVAGDWKVQAMTMDLDSRDRRPRPGGKGRRARQASQLNQGQVQEDRRMSIRSTIAAISFQRRCSREERRWRPARKKTGR